MANVKVILTPYSPIGLQSYSKWVGKYSYGEVCEREESYTICGLYLYRGSGWFVNSNDRSNESYTMDMKQLRSNTDQIHFRSSLLCIYKSDRFLVEEASFSSVMDLYGISIKTKQLLNHVWHCYKFILRLTVCHFGDVGDTSHYYLFTNDKEIWPKIEAELSQVMELSKTKSK